MLFVFFAVLFAAFLGGFLCLLRRVGNCLCCCGGEDGKGGLLGYPFSFVVTHPGTLLLADGIVGHHNNHCYLFTSCINECVSSERLLMQYNHASYHSNIFFFYLLRYFEEAGLSLLEAAGGFSSRFTINITQQRQNACTSATNYHSTSILNGKHDPPRANEAEEKEVTSNTGPISYHSCSSWT